MERQQLIDEKHEVQGRIRSLRPRVERARREASTRRQQRRLEQLQAELDRLMNRESELRQAIDRTR